MEEQAVSNHDIIEEMILRFPHLALNIFKQLNLKKLKICLMASTQWSAFIQNQKFPWIKKILSIRQFYKQSNNEKWDKVMKNAPKEILKKLLLATNKFFNPKKAKNQWAPLHVGNWQF